MGEPTESERAEGPSHGPAQLGANILAGVLAGFAVEQTAEGAYKVLHDNWATLTAPTVAGILAAAIFLGLTLARFYQGNTIYLLTQYAVWDPREVAPGALATTPVRHLSDVGFHILEYVALVVAGNLLSDDPSLVRPAVAVVALFAVDAAWSLWGVISTRRFDEPPGRGSAQRRSRASWLVINGVGAVLLLGAVLFARNTVVWVLPLLLAVLAVIDYRFNYEFYFGEPAEPEHIRLSQAARGMEYLAALAQVRSAPKGDSPREKLTHALDLIFEYLMNDANARALFARGKARLHVGIYVLDLAAGELKPVYRIAPEGMKLKNRAFPSTGESYIGSAYVQLNEPTRALIFRRTDPNLDPKGKTRTKYYQSSVLANLFWPPSGEERKKIGTINITSDQEDYFTESFHQVLAVGLAAEVTWAVQRVFGDVSAKEVRSRLAELPGGVIHTKV